MGDRSEKLHSNTKIAFFDKRHKVWAINTPVDWVVKEYEKSERALKRYAMNGDNEKLVEEMRNHNNLEYIMLYQMTPEFKERMKRK